MPRLLLILAMLSAMTVSAAASATDLKLRALLNSGNVVSATDSPATGEARVVLQDDNDLRIDLVYSDLAERATGAALHVGKASENGELVEKLELDVDQDAGRVVGAQFDVSPDVAVRIRAGEAYLVITTLEHPGGVIRGQLVPQPARLPEPDPSLPDPPLADD